RVVAAAVERTVRHATEVAHARQRHVHQAVQELVHARAAQRHLGADRHALAQPEVRNGLAGPRHYGLLTGDDAELFDDAVHQLRVLRRLTQPDVDHDLLESRHAVRVREPELLTQPGADAVLVVYL